MSLDFDDHDCGGWYVDESDYEDYSTGTTVVEEKETKFARQTKIMSNMCHTRRERSLGVSFIAVRGKYSMCAVSWDKDQDKGFVQSCLEENVLVGMLDQISGYAVEDMVEMTPRGIVSLLVGTDGVHEGPSAARLNEENAISFLKEKLESGSIVTFEETVQATFFALQELLEEDFKAEDIEVCVLREGEVDTDPLPIEEIEEQLAIIQGNVYSTI